jgi:hypothetical protein
MGKPARKKPDSTQIAAMFGQKKADAPPPTMSRRRMDGWYNALAGFGDVDRDKRESHEVVLEIWDQLSAEELWRADAMMGRAVEKVPREMTRRGWHYNVADDKEAAEAMRMRAEELKVRSKIRRALEYQRAFGGGAILIGADDGQTVEKPLNEDRIDKLSFLTELTPRELIPVRYYNDPLLPTMGNRKSSSFAGGPRARARSRALQRRCGYTRRGW